EPDVTECFLKKLAHRVRFAGGDHIVVRLGWLQHAPHRAGVFLGVTPVSFRIKVAEFQLVAQSELDPCCMRGNFACDEFEAAPLTLMIEENSRGRVDLISLPVIPGQVKARYLGDAVYRAGMEPGALGLGSFLGLAKHLARSRKIEPG